MSDYLWPKALVSSHELRLLMAIRYSVDGKTKGRFFKVKVIAWELGPTHETESPVKVPFFYHRHLRRFLWRQQLFMWLYTQNSTSSITLPNGLRSLLQRYIQYMDGMVEGLLTTVKRNRRNAEFRSSIFDLYLVTDYYLGGIHQPDLGDQWRLENKEIILERVTMDDIDWAEHYTTLDINMPQWSGSAYDFNVTTIPQEHWKDLALIVGRHFGFPDPKQATRVLGKRKRNAVRDKVEIFVESEDEPEEGHVDALPDEVTPTSGTSAAMADSADESHINKKVRRVFENTTNLPEPVAGPEPTAAPTDEPLQADAPRCPVPTTPDMEPPIRDEMGQAMGSPDDALAVTPPGGSVPVTPDAPAMEGTENGLDNDDAIAEGEEDVPGPSALADALLPPIDLLDRAMGQPEDVQPNGKHVVLGDIDLPELNFLDMAFFDEGNAEEM